MKPTNKLFFSSLKQLEKRLKLDDGNPPPPPSQPPPPPETTDSFSSSPIYFQNHHTTASLTSTSSIEQPPLEFLSDNPKFHDSENNSPKIKGTTVDDVDSMIGLLKLSDFDGKRAEEEMPDDYNDDEFYDKIVGVKGPKCKKEVERLDGWIKYYNNNGRQREPLRLAHLLLAKAALLGSDGDNELQFPSTIHQFLHIDPPPLDY